jgi:predicted DNA-binding transcriptional regulator YafY
VTAGGAVAGMEEAALAALAKLDRLLPERLRAGTRAVRAATVRVGSWGSDVDPSVLVVLAQAAAGEERLRLVYRDRQDRETERRVDPYRVVSTGRRWYLVAYDVDRRDWRTFRVDRVASVTATGHRFRLEDAPDAAALVSRATSVAPYRWAAVVRVDAPVDEVARRVPPTVALIEEADGATVLTTGSDHLEAIAGHLVGLGLPFEVVEPPELRDLLCAVAEDVLARHGRRGMLPA